MVIRGIDLNYVKNNWETYTLADLRSLLRILHNTDRDRYIIDLKKGDYVTFIPTEDSIGSYLWPSMIGKIFLVDRLDSYGSPSLQDIDMTNPPFRWEGNREVLYKVDSWSIPKGNNHV